MAVVPILPTKDVPQKPADAKVIEGAGLVIGVMAGEGSGVPKDLAGDLTPALAPQGAEWVDTPWGKGYKLRGSPLIMGQYNIDPPMTYHVLFKPEPVNPMPQKDALVFGEIDMGRHVAANGPLFEWVDPASTSFAAFAADGEGVFSFIPLMPVEHDWYAITVTYDGAKVSFYINGMYTLEQSEHVSAPIENRSWALGGPGLNGGGFNGVIADARVYNRILAPSEIAQITSGPSMWVDYGYTPPPMEGHMWRRHIWQTGRGRVRVARRVAKIRV